MLPGGRERNTEGEIVPTQRYFVTDKEGYEHLRSRVGGLPEDFEAFEIERERMLAHEERSGIQVTRVMTHRRILTDFMHWCTQTETPASAEMLDLWLNRFADQADHRSATDS
jgi:hypothetical protein